MDQSRWSGSLEGELQLKMIIFNAIFRVVDWEAASQIVKRKDRGLTGGGMPLWPHERCGLKEKTTGTLLSLEEDLLFSHDWRFGCNWLCTRSFCVEKKNYSAILSVPGRLRHTRLLGEITDARLLCESLLSDSVWHWKLIFFTGQVYAPFTYL